MIIIRKPLCFSEIGKKDNQEDYLFPQYADVNTRIFILCDGMGGHENGEVASATAANALGNFLNSCSQIDIPTFELGLAKTYDALDKMPYSSSKTPGTTMACLCLNDDNYLVAHIGDSRIYHIRPSLFNPKSNRGGILYQSSDHSLVNDLLKAGELTEEEARDFPQKNIITRALQPGLSKKYKADIYTFDDIQKGDYFFICCDGILEQLSNEKLCEILADNHLNDNQKLDAIRNICAEKTRDNYSCWLIPISDVKIVKSNLSSQSIKADVEVPENLSESSSSGEVVTTVLKASLVDTKTVKSDSFWRNALDIVKRISCKIWIAITLICVLLIIGFFSYRYFKKDATTNKIEQLKKQNKTKSSIENPKHSIEELKPTIENPKPSMIESKPSVEEFKSAMEEFKPSKEKLIEDSTDRKEPVIEL